MCTAALRKEEVEKWHLGCRWKGGCVSCSVMLGGDLDIATLRIRLRVRLNDCRSYEANVCTPSRPPTLCEAAVISTTFRRRPPLC